MNDKMIEVAVEKMDFLEKTISDNLVLFLQPNRFRFLRSSMLAYLSVPFLIETHPPPPNKFMRKSTIIFLDFFHRNISHPISPKHT